MLLLATGLGLLICAWTISPLFLLLVAAVTAGIGHGLAFLAGVTAVNHAAPTDRHAEVLSSFYVIIYLGIGLPVIGVGFLGPPRRRAVPAGVHDSRPNTTVCASAQPT